MVATMPARLLLGATALVIVAGAQPFDYPSARAPSSWANTDASLTHHVTFMDGSVARAALLRLNPAGFGPSYAFGFFCTNHNSAPCADFLLGVAVVYCNSGGLMTSVVAGIPQVVWSANRGRPVGDGATAQLTPAGDLVLKAADGTVVWSAGTRSVAGIAINSDGNLVMVDATNKTVWQSFDHPTDTLVIGQLLRQGARLVANTSAADWSPSRLYLAVTNDGLDAYADAKPPQRYFHLGFGNSVSGAYATYANGSLTVVTSTSASATPSPAAAPLAVVQLPPVPAGTVQYMRLEYDGHLRLYEWRPAGWAPVFDVIRLFPDDCAFPTVCGAYGVCTDSSQCSCPDATNFRPVDFRRPNRGCVPAAPPASCAATPKGAQRLVSLPGLAYFNDHDTSLRTLERVSEAACKKACLDDCRCAAAQFIYGADAGDGFCYLQSEVFSMETSQPEVVHYNSTMHLKVQATRRSARF